MTLDKKLARLRKKEGLSQAEVSEALDVSRQAVTKWETGVSRPSTENLNALSKLYHVSLEYLLDESEEELPAAAPASAAAACRQERGTQEQRKRWIWRLVIGGLVLALLVCFLFWYGSRQKEDEIALHSIRGEATSLLEGFEVSAKSMRKASASLPMEYGETITITASYSPASASVDFGLIDSDGLFYPVQGSNGRIDQTIGIDLRGTYTFAVRNNSNYKVFVSGFINY